MRTWKTRKEEAMQIGYTKKDWYTKLSKGDQDLVDALVAAQFYQGNMLPLEEQEYVPLKKV